MENIFISTHEKWEAMPEHALIIAEEALPQNQTPKDRLKMELEYLQYIMRECPATQFVLSGDRKLNAVICRGPEALFNLIKAKLLDILGVMAD